MTPGVTHTLSSQQGAFAPLVHERRQALTELIFDVDAVVCFSDHADVCL